jgi:hypothetical protein
MRIEYLDQDDIVNIIGTQLDIYNDALSTIRALDVPKCDNTKSLMGTYRDMTASNIGIAIASLFDLSNDDCEDLTKRISDVLYDTNLHPVDAKGKVVLIVLRYLKKALYDLEEKLSDRRCKVEDAANGLETKINNLERAVEASIKNN